MLKKYMILCTVLMVAGCASHDDRAVDVKPAPAAAPMVAEAPATKTQREASGKTLQNAPAQAPAKPDVKPTAPGVDPRIARAAGFADRILPNPTPQWEHIKKGELATAWDREKYLDDPESYLNYADIGRVLVTAEPAANIEVIESVGGSAFLVPPGGSAPLVVKTDPGMPVNFMAVSGGEFPSGTSSITVAADINGIARTTFIASHASGACPVKVSSPVRASMVDFMIRVDPTPPAKAPDKP